MRWRTPSERSSSGIGASVGAKTGTATCCAMVATLPTTSGWGEADQARADWSPSSQVSHGSTGAQGELDCASDAQNRARSIGFGITASAILLVWRPVGGRQQA